MDSSPAPTAAPAPGPRPGPHTADAPPAAAGHPPAEPEPTAPAPDAHVPDASPTPAATPPGAPAVHPTPRHGNLPADGPAAHPYPYPYGQGFRPAPAHRSRARRLAAPVGAMAAVVAAFGYVATVDPNEPGHYPVCPMLRVTGLFCPGCGGLRSAHAFAHGDLAAAFGSNAVAVVGYGVFAVVWVLWTLRANRGVPARTVLRPVHWWAVGALLVAFTVVRNLPFGAALAP
ncbi:DUF2752 domain-containing protein [Streptomyces sp. DT24]|uniref:DUF2752 domain-containing protein n=1 Tax=Streptomyces sp. DT24 TaxID=3416520 RepID=UPI003CFA58A4